MDNFRFEQFSLEEKIKRAQEKADFYKFTEGRTLFEYNYEFPRGEKLEAWQDENGIGHIVIKREGDVIFDAQDLLPDFKFVTPTYFQKFPDEEALLDYIVSPWAVCDERKFIFLGEMKSPQDLLAFLHEVGHATSDKPEETKALVEFQDTKFKLLDKEDKERVYETLIQEDEAKILSRVERRAWARAILKLREIAEKTQIDLRFLFPNFETLKNYVADYLATFRRNYEWIIKEGYDPDFYKDLQKYFDKWQYKEK